MIAVIDYGMGNLGSIANMLKKVGAESTLTSDPAVLAAADGLLLPGVGAFDAGMKNLADRGLVEPLTRSVMTERKPILGVCLGLQLFGQGSEEGLLPGLGWLDARTVRFRFSPEHGTLRIPHMGWNTVQVRQPHPLVANMGPDARFYFVHSYRLACPDESTVVAETEYGGPFPSIVARGNIAGVQFHPEKSHRFGMALLKNFAESLK